MNHVQAKYIQIRYLLKDETTWNYHKPPDTIWNHAKQPDRTWNYPQPPKTIPTHPKLSAAPEPIRNQLETTQTSSPQFVFV